MNVRFVICVLFSFVLLSDNRFVLIASGQSPPLLNFAVQGANNVTCILAQFSGTYQDPSTNQTVNIDGTLNPDNSNCLVTTQSLSIDLTGGSTNGTLSFSFGQNGNTTQLTAIVYNADGVAFISNTTNPLFSVPIGNSFKCDSGIATDLTSPTTMMHISLKPVRFNAFRESNSTMFETDLDCSADAGSNKTVPMIIAFVLAAMVVILLVGYIILRRREDKSVYQTV